MVNIIKDSVKTDGRSTNLCGIFDAGVHINPFDIVGGNQLANGNVPPISPSKAGILQFCGGRMVQEVLYGGLSERGVSLRSWRGW